MQKETLYKNEGGAVVGDICFCVGNWYFPEKAWDDFVVRILYWFSQKLIKLRFDKKKYLEFPFMEGDFKTSLSLNKENKVTVEFIEGDSFADQKETILKILVQTQEVFFVRSKWIDIKIILITFGFNIDEKISLIGKMR